ncbi:hypothetical protein L6452_17629 [Arctium lappa]|uniref:Uncharacterized protein n=1 Tax=Arctium lappa TaxID=4217 RepID=A0ACB9C3X5_ARCLA|nr:hypothetical protein L6452_17629 [Arctium lappa]
MTHRPRFCSPIDPYESLPFKSYISNRVSTTAVYKSNQDLQKPQDINRRVHQGTSVGAPRDVRECTTF